MTTTPIGPPAPAIDQGAPGSSSSAGCGDVFLALVQSILDAEPSLTQPAVPQVADPTPGEVVPAQAEDPQADAADPTLTIVTPPSMLAALAAGLPTLVAPAPVVPSEAVGAAPTGSPTGSPTDTTAVAGVTADSMPSAATTTPGAPAPGARELRAQTERPPATPAAVPAGATEDEPAATPATPPAGSAPAASSATTPVAPPSAVAAPAAPTTPVGTPAAAPASPVARQVFPEIVRLTTSTEGPQRVTIRLNPESLGEVRVVLTERRGVLEVSLSANSEARRALLDGTPELQRLLDAVGRGDSRIVVRDGAGVPVTAPAPGASTTGTSSGQAGPGTSWSGDLAGGAGAGAGRSGAETGPDQGRRPMPGSTTATDGITAATSSRTTTETVTGARPGLDVTM
jgi:hypothetical protein